MDLENGKSVGLQKRDVELTLEQQGSQRQQLTLPVVKNQPITYSQPYIYMWFLHICGSASKDSNNHRLYSTIVFTTEKHPCISGCTQFKPVLFKGQLQSEHQKLEVPCVIQIYNWISSGPVCALAQLNKHWLDNQEYLKNNPKLFTEDLIHEPQQTSLNSPSIFTFFSSNSS